jgi:hypothetical protein
MTRCHKCGGPFGLIRHSLRRYMHLLAFCSKKCLDAYKADR